MVALDIEIRVVLTQFSLSIFRLSIRNTFISVRSQHFEHHFSHCHFFFFWWLVHVCDFIYSRCFSSDHAVVCMLSFAWCMFSYFEWLPFFRQSLCVACNFCKIHHDSIRPCLDLWIHNLFVSIFLIVQNSFVGFMPGVASSHEVCVSRWPLESNLCRAYRVSA